MLIKQTNKIPDAATVRRLLKSQGFSDISVKRSQSPFSGTTFFSVQLHIPEGVTVMSQGSSTRPGTQYFSDDAGTAGRLAALNQACQQLEAA